MSLEELRGALADGDKHLGDLIWWSLSDARIDRSTLEAIWAGAQLDPALLPELPTDEVSVHGPPQEGRSGGDRQADRILI